MRVRLGYVLLFLGVLSVGIVLRVSRVLLFGWVLDGVDPWFNLWVLRYMDRYGLLSLSELTSSNPATHVFWYPFGMDIAGFLPGIHVALYAFHQVLGVFGAAPIQSAALFPVAAFAMCAAGLYLFVRDVAGDTRGIVAVLMLSLLYVSRFSLGFATRYTLGLALAPWLLWLVLRGSRDPRYLVPFAAAVLVGLATWRGFAVPVGVAVLSLIVLLWNSVDRKVLLLGLAPLIAFLVAVGVAYMGKAVAVLGMGNDLQSTVAEYVSPLPLPVRLGIYAVVALGAAYVLHEGFAGELRSQLPATLWLLASMALFSSAAYFFDMFTVSLVAFVASLPSTRTIRLMLVALLVGSLFTAPFNVARPPLIMGGGMYPVATRVWLDALSYINSSLPRDAVVVAWWDYGYWITALGNRASVADPSTVNGSRIRLLAKAFASPPESFGRYLRGMGIEGAPVYVVVYASVHVVRNGSCAAVFVPVSPDAEGDVPKYVYAIARLAGLGMGDATVCHGAVCLLNYSSPAVANSTMVRLVVHGAYTALRSGLGCVAMPRVPRGLLDVDGFELVKWFSDSVNRRGYEWFLYLFIYRYRGG